MHRLVCGVQSYDWGRRGRASKVAHYAERGGAGEGETVDETRPYAELWMGTHPSCPSHVLGDDSTSSTSTLDALIASDPKRHLGQAVAQRYENALPFLFKVLSIGKALSIQAHPDKTLAKRLHGEKPELYRDANHKPEMALALTRFEGFCGFRPLQEVCRFLQEVQELVALVGEDKTSAFLKRPTKDTLKDVFGALMQAKDEDVTKQVRALVKRIKAASASSPASAPAWHELVERLDEQFPNDVGIFCTFFLNVVHLEPGQAVFLKANDPHAYLSGDIIECMASSDNVVRAGLTPKTRDTATLLSMLTFDSAPADAQLMRPAAYRQGGCNSSYTLLYDPPIEEFSLLLTRLPAGADETIPPLDGPSILIVTQGAGEITVSSEAAAPAAAQTPLQASEGTVWYVDAGSETRYTAGREGEWIIYRAFCQVRE